MNKTLHFIHESVYFHSIQVRKERDLLHSRVDSMEAELERERGLHRRELRRKAKELQEVRQHLLPIKSVNGMMMASAWHTNTNTFCLVQGLTCICHRTMQVQDELARAKDQIRDLRMQIRQLMDEADSRDRRASSSERIRQTYTRTASDSRPGSRPSSGRG